MSEEIIYSNVVFNKQQKCDDIGKEEKEGEKDVTYSEVRTRPRGTGNAQQESKSDSGNTSSPVGSKVVTPKRVSHEVVVVSLVCICFLLLVLITTLAVLYALNITYFQAEKSKIEIRCNQTATNLTTQNKGVLLELQQCKTNLTTSQANQCPSGWESYNGSCYKLYEDKLTWEQSQYACIHEGGHLVIIESLQEQEFIRKKVGNTDITNGYWIGMTDMKTEGVWVWMDNTNLNTNIKFWDLNNGTDAAHYPEPNDSGGEDCAQIGKQPPIRCVPAVQLIVKLLPVILACGKFYLQCHEGICDNKASSLGKV
ncbi:hypothetical protein DPEC_G00095610 [Dallia pectoralis]|uniref:Uncharacterized protein n=1 Tax=Dallia pectoralis TaxID=75939 RepID=A0ACC2GVN8_DALPE|nr:hypothetical protein DPEC_G00095610 [Dallia pectoralis]